MPHPVGAAQHFRVRQFFGESAHTAAEKYNSICLGSLFGFLRREFCFQWHSHHCLRRTYREESERSEGEEREKKRKRPVAPLCRIAEYHHRQRRSKQKKHYPDRIEKYENNFVEVVHG